MAILLRFAKCKRSEKASKKQATRQEEAWIVQTASCWTTTKSARFATSATRTAPDDEMDRPGEVNPPTGQGPGYDPLHGAPQSTRPTLTQTQLGQLHLVHASATQPQPHVSLPLPPHKPIVVHPPELNPHDGGLLMVASHQPPPSATTGALLSRQRAPVAHTNNSGSSHVPFRRSRAPAKVKNQTHFPLESSLANMDSEAASADALELAKSLSLRPGIGAPIPDRLSKSKGDPHPRPEVKTCFHCFSASPSSAYL